VSELAIGGDVDPPSIEYQAISFSPFLLAQAFASVQSFRALMTETSQSTQYQTLSRKMEPSPLMVIWEGLSLLTAIDSLGWGVCQEVLPDVSAQLGWKHSADSITWSLLSSSPIWWSTWQEKASGFIECLPS